MMTWDGAVPPGSPPGSPPIPPPLWGAPCHHGSQVGRSTQSRLRNPKGMNTKHNKNRMEDANFVPFPVSSLGA